jgi:DNA-binding PadR family transcriptional regulator
MRGASALPNPGGFGRHCRPDWRELMALRAMGGDGEDGPRGGHGRHGHRHGGPRGGRGFFPGGPGGFGPGDFGPGGFGRGGRRRRMRRGDVRAALLVLLDEEPRNGYGLMQEIEARSEGAWRPSPGSVYPALAQLEDEGLVAAQEAEGRKTFALTDAGRAHVDEHREELGEPWQQATAEADEERRDLRSLVWQLGAAAMQVGAAGTDAQVKQAQDVLTEARKSLYRLLAEDDAPAGDDGPAAA